MTLESSTIKISSSAEDIFNHLTDVGNFEGLMPENITKFKLMGENKFIFALAGMPEIMLEKKIQYPNERIILGAAGGKLDFSIEINISSIGIRECEAKILFEGKFKPMMSMMIKGPISKFIETLAINIEKSI
jgi:hypothetical protein